MISFTQHTHTCTHARARLKKESSSGYEHNNTKIELSTTSKNEIYRDPIVPLNLLPFLLQFLKSIKHEKLIISTVV